jgi:hypothetical protein
MAEANETIRRPRNLAWITVIAIALLLLALVLWRAGASARKMSSVIASDGKVLSHFHVGDTAKFVVEVADSSKTGTLTGIVLTKKTDELFLRTSDRATVHWENQTKIVMGKSDDLHPGAVAHITASVLQDHTFAAQQLVILTGYVKVQSQ